MDGVIVDSMPYHFIAWYEALKPLGIRVNCFDVYSREGERWEETLKDLLAGAKITPSQEILKRVFKQRQKIFKRYFKQFIFKDVGASLACLHNKGYLLGLVTGTPLKEVRHILPQKIFQQFDCIVTGDTVERGKPHPEPYLKASNMLGVKPSECVVIENAPLGIDSAKKAGMFCIGFTTSLPKEYLKDADVTADTLEAIIGLIDRTCIKQKQSKKTNRQ